MSYEYEIEVETSAFVDPNLVAQKVRNVIRRIIERYGIFYITTEARVRTGEGQEITEEGSSATEAEAGAGGEQRGVEEGI